MDPKFVRTTALRNEVRGYLYDIRFYFVACVILVACAWFFYTVYVPYGRVLDAEVLQDSILQGGPVVKGTYTRDAIVLTTVCAVLGIGSLFWAIVSYGRLQAVLRNF